MGLCWDAGKEPIPGAVTGAFMFLGLVYGNTKPKDMETKLAAYAKVRELNSAIEDIYGTSQCQELLKRHATEADVAQRKHHAIICRKVVRVKLTG